MHVRRSYLRTFEHAKISAQLESNCYWSDTALNLNMELADRAMGPLKSDKDSNKKTSLFAF